MAGGYFARHVRRTPYCYHQRQRDPLELVPDILGDLVVVRPAPAGMRLVGLLPHGIDSRAVGWAMAERGLAVTPLSPSAPASMTDGREGLLLGYGNFDRETTAAALRVLAEVIREVQASAARAGRVPGMR